MANPSPIAHPLAVILSQNVDFYGHEASALIRELAEHLTARELFTWWENEIGWDGTPYLALESARLRHGALLAAMLAKAA